MATRALIIGGGIGGLATAVALDRIGIEPAVFERAPVIEEVGAGLSLWSNAVKALRRLGLDEPVIAHSSILERAITMTADGGVLDTASVGELSRRADAPSLCVHRADLQRGLIAAIAPDRWHTDRECMGVRPLLDVKSMLTPSLKLRPGSPIDQPSTRTDPTAPVYSSRPAGSAPPTLHSRSISSPSRIAAA